MVPSMRSTDNPLIMSDNSVHMFSEWTLFYKVLYKFAKSVWAKFLIKTI
jgi:hypothetical protein